MMRPSIQSYLARGRIACHHPYSDVECIRRLYWAVTCSGRHSFADTLQCAGMSPRKFPFSWGMWPPSATWFLGPTLVSPDDISIGSAVFAQLTYVPNTQTHRQTTLCATSVATGRIYTVHEMRRSRLIIRLLATVRAVRGKNAQFVFYELSTDFV